MDDTFLYVKLGSVEYVLPVLNSFHDNIKFTYEQENNIRLPLLDVLFIRDYEKLNTTFFCEDAHNNPYFHWDSFSTINSK